MTNQQQPECPVDRVFPCPRCNGDGCFRCGDSGIANEADDYRARLEEAEARASAEADRIAAAVAVLRGDETIQSAKQWPSFYSQDVNDIVCAIDKALAILEGRDQ